MGRILTLTFGVALGAALVALAVAGASNYAAAPATATLGLRVVSQTPTTITLGWSRRPGYGYLLSRDGVVVSRTYDKSRTTAKFAKGASTYEVAVMAKGARGVAAADTSDGLPVHIISQTSSTITVGWAPQPGYGYLFSSDRAVVSRTYDLFRASAKFAKAGRSEVAVITKGASGRYPPRPLITVSTRGNDSTCRRSDGSKPCATFNRAYAISRCGDVIDVLGGTYGDQAIFETAVGESCTSPITIQPAPAARVTVRHISLGGDGCSTNTPDNLTLTGFKVTWGINITGDARNVTVDRFDGGAFAIGGCSPTNITIKNSDWGPCRPIPQAGDDCRTHFTGDPRSGQNKITEDATNILIENNLIHEFRIDDPEHWECVWVGGGINVTFRGNVFRTCQTNAIALPDTELRGTWTFENNWFGWDRNYATTTALKLGLGGGCPTGTVIVRFNSFGPGQAVGDEEGGQACGRIIVVGNILSMSYLMQGAQCISGAVYDRNIWITGVQVTSNDDAGTRTLRGTPCGTNAVRTSVVPYMDYDDTTPAEIDFHLKRAKHVADNFVPASTPQTALAIDKDRQARKAPRDAGADER